METFKYYKRGQGELDTSNFPEIIGQGSVEIDVLDEKTFFSLMTLNLYIAQNVWYRDLNFKVYVNGYVAHMRSDKDLFPPSQLYKYLLMDIECFSVQHESTNKIKSATITADVICSNLQIPMNKDNTYIGADSSVPKFFPDVDFCAEKVRENGKVIGSTLDSKKIPDSGAIIIVDDILGGGATIDAVMESIKDESNSTGDICLWVRYNEDIHHDDFLSQFDNIYIGDTI